MPRPNFSEKDLEAIKHRLMVRSGGMKERVGVEDDTQRERCVKLAEKSARTSIAGSNPAHAPLPQYFFVPGPLPGQNTFMGNGNRWTYGKAKKQWAVRIGLAIQQAKLQPMQRVQITWVWQECNTRRDPDNFTGISKKFILDTLVSTGILPDDGWDEIAGWTDHWHVDASNPGVLVTLKEAP